MKNDHYPCVGKILLIPAEQIRAEKDIDDELSRTEVELMAASIRNNGLLYPLVVSMISPTIFSVISNETLFRAAVMAGLTEIPCILTGTEQDKLNITRLIGDCQQRKLHYLQITNFLKQAAETDHIPIPEISEQLCLSLREVTELLKLSELSEDIQQTLIQYQLPQETAMLLAKEPEKNREALIKLTVSQHLTSDQLKEQIRILNRNDTKGRIVVFKDVTVFTNTIDHAISAMAEAGINALCEKTETDQNIEYHISISKAHTYLQTRVHTG